MNKKIIYGIILGLAILLVVIFLITNRTYKVDFHTMGGTIYKTQNVKKGDFAKDPGTPYLDGFVFLYWIDEATGEKFTFDMPIEKNIILKSVYQNKITSEIV